jgi:hypothetical protein
VTPKDAFGVGVRIIGIYWVSTGLIDWLLAAVRGAGVNLGPSSSVERDLIFGALNGVIGMLFVAGARDLEASIYDRE